MTPQAAKRSVADSPWTWVLLFAVVAMVALAAIGPKYGRRQAKLEGKYAGRTAATANDGQATPSIDGSQQRLVPVTSLAAVLAVIAAVAAGRLTWMATHRTAAVDGPSLTPESHPARRP